MKSALRMTLAVLALISLVRIVRAGDDSKKLEGTPQVKAYRANVKAIQAGDWEAYKKSMVKEAGPQMEKQIKEMGKTPKEMLSFMASMTPSDLTVTALKVEGKKATLTATGKVGGEMNKGTIELAQEDGQWKVGQQSWSNAK
ncbi:MAG: hypothetical protein ACRD16_04950 [Thermoanaerobaculia bacterium]